MIFGFWGVQRSGKTLMMTALGGFIAQLVPQPIYANYTVAIPGVEVIRFDNWKELKNVYNAMILFDEVGTSIDSRNTKSTDQIEFTHLFAQMGKKGNTFMYTAQKLDTVEKRIRNNTDYLIRATRLWPGNDIMLKWEDAQESFEIRQLVGYYYLKDPTPIYKLYDSFEVITSQIAIESGTNGTYKYKKR